MAGDDTEWAPQTALFLSTPASFNGAVSTKTTCHQWQDDQAWSRWRNKSYATSLVVPHWEATNSRNKSHATWIVVPRWEATNSRNKSYATSLVVPHWEATNSHYSDSREELNVKSEQTSPHWSSIWVPPVTDLKVLPPIFPLQFASLLLKLRCPLLQSVWNRAHTCKIWGFHGGDYEEWRCKNLRFGGTNHASVASYG
jgi:hypothetical protein